MRRAINRFESALRGYPGYAHALSGRCLALLQESLISSDDRVLADADRACGRVHTLSPDLPLVSIARGNLAGRTGHLKRARGLFEQVLEHDPRDADALLGLAEVALAEFRAGDRQADGRAVDYARRAAEAEPGFWKPPFTLARAHYFAGDVDRAIRSGGDALALDANAPDSSMGREQLCVAYYFARDFERAIAQCAGAIEVDQAGGRPAHHEMWGNLGDAYRQASRTAEAADAYALLAQPEEAMAAYERGTAECAGFGATPDLDVLHVRDLVPPPGMSTASSNR